MSSKCFQDEAESILQVMLEFYSPYFTIKHEFIIADTKLNALAEYHSREEKNLFGMKLNKLGAEANEYGMYLVIEDFTPEVLEQVKKIFEVAEKELVKLHPAHGSTTLSLIIFTSQIFEGAEELVKKHELWKKYRRQGWSMARLAIINVNDKRILCNKDGKELKGLIQKALAGKKII